ncbi:2-oxoisovalerate dehydrogenase alpha subunit [Perkinsela sp. CCAP 1560/4]|nr:2-oxoisovalerate dehydrogenase alpha subunit [Perkinsela sp. CCAP 1560/4]|eukprot:KNH07291.1 2-oxoisovalerate dehydrogenase alpha subunit [Perkinsela sp. CCAP 1560/4]
MLWKSSTLLQKADAEKLFRFSKQWNLKYASPSAVTTHKLQFTKTPSSLPIYQVLTFDGSLCQKHTSSVDAVLTKDLARKMLETMVRQTVIDKILHDCQRQGRVSFYLSSEGELASIVGSAAGLQATDTIYGQYRESAALLYRGYSMDKMIAQCVGSIEDSALGRQMPIHYGSKLHNFHTISSPVGTQLTQAAGCGYGFRVADSQSVCMCYFGEGTASEGDFHAALNMSATLRCRTVFFCRNNAFAISTSCVAQYAGDGVAGRGGAYGVPSVRVDGNDALAVLIAVRQAREMSIANNTPVLIEAMTYRQDDHSTSDDSTQYREVPQDCLPDPITRLERFITSKGWWKSGETTLLQETTRETIRKLISRHESLPKPCDRTLLDHVYDAKPPNLIKQTSEICTKEIDFLISPE